MYLCSFLQLLSTSLYPLQSATMLKVGFRSVYGPSNAPCKATAGYGLLSTALRGQTLVENSRARAIHVHFFALKRKLEVGLEG